MFSWWTQIEFRNLLSRIATGTRNWAIINAKHWFFCHFLISPVRWTVSTMLETLDTWLSRTKLEWIRPKGETRRKRFIESEEVSTHNTRESIFFIITSRLQVDTSQEGFQSWLVLHEQASKGIWIPACIQRFEFSLGFAWLEEFKFQSVAKTWGSSQQLRGLDIERPKRRLEASSCVW